MGCCLCRDKNSWSHQSGENGDLNNCQSARSEDSRYVRKEHNDRRSLLEILETVRRSADSGSIENSIFSGEVMKGTNVGNTTNDRDVTRFCNQSLTPLKKKAAPIDFPLPNEIIEIVMAFLSSSDLIVLAAVGTERLKNYSFIFLETKIHVSEIPDLLWQFSSKGDLESIKQMFAYVNQQKINVGNVRAKINESHHSSMLSQGKQLSPLMEAARKGHAQVCEYFICQHNAKIDAMNNYNAGYNYYTNGGYHYTTNWTALMIAVACNQTEVIKVLLRHTPDIRFRDARGYHATYIAACEGYLDALKMLVKKDKHVVDLRGPDGMTPLIAASSRNGRVAVCKFLVEQKNADVNIMDYFGGTALTYATNPIIIEILKKNRKYQYLKSYKEEKEFENMIKKHKRSRETEIKEIKRNIRRNIEKMNC